MGRARYPAECFLRRLWRGLREWSGDAAYEAYLRAAAGGEAQKVLSPKEFYLQQLEGKYSRPNRCC